MRWSTVDFNKLVDQLSPGLLIKPKFISFLKIIIAPLIQLHTTTLYEMQIDGRTIYLEKLLNEHYNIDGYSDQNHSATKKIYIEDVAPLSRLYVHQDGEADAIYIEDDDNESDLFIDIDGEGSLSYSFIIFVPDTVDFVDYQMRSLVDKYRYIGHKYTIQTYTL